MRTPRTKKRTRPPCASQPDCASSARNQPHALSLTGKSKRHDQVACRKARERSRVVVEPGAVVIATRETENEEKQQRDRPDHVDRRAAGDYTPRANQDETDEETVTRNARRNSTKESCKQAHTNRANNRRTDVKNQKEAQAERTTANTDDVTRASGSRGASTTLGRAAGAACACNIQARKQRDEVVCSESKRKRCEYEFARSEAKACRERLPT